MKCEYNVFIHDGVQVCGRGAVYKVSRLGKSGKITAEACACEEHAQEWQRDIPDVRIERLS